MSGTAVFRQAHSYMPIKLLDALKAHSITQRDICEAVRQFDGRPLSAPALNLLLNWNKWPTKTPEHSIKQQIEDFLRARGATKDELGALWELGNPEHTFSHKLGSVSPETVARKADRFVALEKLEPEMLSQEAKKHFGFFISPFVDDVNSEEDVFVSPEIRYCRQALYTTAKLGGIVALIAESGAGKSTLRRWLEDRIAKENAPIRILSPQAFDKRTLTAGQICEALIHDLRPDAKIASSLERRARTLKEILEGSASAGNAHALVIEEAHDLSTMTLKQLKRFWELEKGFKKLLSIILIGQPELKYKLDVRTNFEAREFINRCEVVELPPLDKHLEAYLELKFKRVDKKLQEVFAPDSFDAIRARLTSPRRGGGVESLMFPLYVNNLVTKAMNACALIGAPKVSAAVIKDL